MHRRGGSHTRSLFLSHLELGVPDKALTGPLPDSSMVASLCAHVVPRARMPSVSLLEVLQTCWTGALLTSHLDSVTSFNDHMSKYCWGCLHIICMLYVWYLLYMCRHTHVICNIVYMLYSVCYYMMCMIYL